MTGELKPDKLTHEQLMVSTLAMTDALAKLMSAKAITRKKSSKHG
jgi:hypothetical protein